MDLPVATPPVSPRPLSACWTHREQGRPFRLLAASALLYNLGISLTLFLHGLFLFSNGWQEHAIGGVTSAMVVGGVAGVLPLARLTRRYGLRKVLFTSLLVAALAFAGGTVLLGPMTQLFLSFCAGIALSGWIVCVSPAVANFVLPEHQPSAFSILFALSVGAGGLGGILGGYVPGWLRHHGLALLQPGTAGKLADLSCERMALLLGCIVLALAALPILRLKCDGVAEAVSGAPRRDAGLLRCVLAIAFWNLAMGLFNPFVSLFFVRQASVPLNRLSLIFCVVQFVQALALIGVGGRLQHVLGVVPGIVVLQVLAGCMLLLLSRSGAPLRLAVLYGLFMVLQRLCDPVFQFALMRTTPVAERSMATAFCYFAVSVAQAISASAGGYALERCGYPPVLVVAGLAALAAAALSGLLLRPIPATDPAVALSPG